MRPSFRDNASTRVNTATEAFGRFTSRNVGVNAEPEVRLLLIEPRGVFNTGHEGGGRTAENDVWIW